ncbi:uncharacterized protein LOC131935579 [Physella acuta]|uniref:uncharacterized protein LOC131935579 n=1 Tax=Physella acuta TaxID=109671 RepID=UPI0027DBF4AF|nr:uncharacterized protein LOC131935579 [Physella acuta]XP_059148046.1 uncharacterized protein LOC131935579 [Physella acuta]XP_059148047.1 uncharacterized protein LOC131935579 [Physella acuta]
MVVKKSEYQNQYKASVIKKHQDVYLENLSLRHQRRDQQFLHTPICWGETSDEDEIVTSDSNDEGSAAQGKNKKKTVCEPEEQYQSLAEILTESKAKSDAFKKLKKCDQYDLEVDKTCSEHLNIARTDIKDIPDKSQAVTDLVKDERKKCPPGMGHTYALTTEKLPEVLLSDNDEPTHGDMKNSQFNLRQKNISQKRSKEPLTTKKEISTLRNKQFRIESQDEGKYREHQTVVPPLSLSSRLQAADRQLQLAKPKRPRPSSRQLPASKPPFMAYGVGDREDSVSVHRTHNVRALADVYPLALKAKTRREEDHKKHKQRLVSARSAESLLDKLSARSACDKGDWESEYRQQFHGYEPKEYQRAVSSRAVIPRATPIHAVHRGGCLVINVD